MSNYNSLKATINANIKTNGNQEITGSVLNSVLTAMVNTLGAGYMYAGMAVPGTNPGSPDYRIFYIAATPGTYSNFGGIVVANGEIAILKFDSSWHKDLTGFANASQVEKEIGEVFRVLSSDSGVINATYSTGYINSNGGVSASNYADHSDFIQIQSGMLYYVYSKSSDNWRIAYYSSANESGFISAQPLGETTSEYQKRYLHIPENATHVRITKDTTSQSNFNYISETLVPHTLLEYVQILQDEIDSLDPATIEEMKTLLSERTETEVQTTYSDGYINSSGRVASSNFAVHSDFIQIQSGGRYVLHSKAADNWRIGYYSSANESGFISAQPLGETTTEPINIDLVIPSGATHVRVTKDTTSVSKLLFVVSSLMTTPVPDTLADLQSQIDALGNGKTYVVNPNGGGDYIGLVQALRDLRDDETPKTIFVLGGNYDILQEMGGQSYLDSIPADVQSSQWDEYSNFVPNNTSIIGIGNVTLNFNVPANTPSGKMSVVTPMAFRGNVSLENMTIIASNCRYCIHDETGLTAENYKKTFKNIKLFKTGGGFNQAYGGGHSANNTIRFENCLFSSDATPVWSIHDNRSNEFSSIELINCAFVYTGSLANTIALRFGTLNAISGKKFVQINNCTIQGGGKISLADYQDYPNRYDLLLIKSGNPTIEDDSGQNPYPPMVIE